MEEKKYATEQEELEAIEKEFDEEMRELKELMKVSQKKYKKKEFPLPKSLVYHQTTFSRPQS